MRIKQLDIKDFRCFEALQMDFAPEYNVHVILAENMAGKSALMRALRVAASIYPASIISPQVSLGIDRQDHRIIGQSVSDSDKSLTASIEVRASLLNADAVPVESEWKRYKDKIVGGYTKLSIIENMVNPQVIARENYTSVANKVKNSQLPLLNFIGTEYLYVQSAETGKFSFDGSAIEGYKDCFLDKSIKKFLFGWLTKIDNWLDEKARKPVVSAALGDLPNNAMMVFQKAICSVLPDIDQIDWFKEKKQPVVQFKNGDVRLFDMLSDGYRYLILLAGELATRAFILNKHLEAEVLEKIHGLVLIDEFGIHLHPNLQSEALARLQKTFPNIQFIISTHSPLLINGLRKEQIHLLEIEDSGKRTIRHPDEDAIGLGAEGILLKMFGLTSTYDHESLSWNETYKDLFRKKSNGGLNEAETEQFKALGTRLAAFRFDPSLHIGQEDDSITRIVREELEKRKSISRDNKNVSEEELREEIKSIINSF